jgi:hypothetical protein
VEPRGWYGPRHIAFWIIVTGICTVAILIIALLQQGNSGSGSPAVSTQSAAVPPAQIYQSSPAISSPASAASSAAISPPPSAASSALSSPLPTAPIPASVSAWYQGEWSGIATTAGGYFPVAIQIEAGSIGDQIGTYAILNGYCRGTLTLLSVGPSSITVRGDYSYNAYAACSTMAEVDLVPDGQSLQYDVIADQFANGQSFEGDELAIATLTRQ